MAAAGMCHSGRWDGVTSRVASRGTAGASDGRECTATWPWLHWAGSHQLGLSSAVSLCRHSGHQLPSAAADVYQETVISA